MVPSRRSVRKQHEGVPLPIWQELLAGVEMAFLRISPVFWGYAVPPGDGSAVVVVPGFLGTDLYLGQFRNWLERIGYKPFYSNIGWNADCPNLLIRQRLNEVIDTAYRSTGRKIHLIGHSLGGTISCALAAQMPNRIASVITLASPINGVSAHSSVLRTAQLVRRHILERHGRSVLPECYTAQCTCNFVESLARQFPKSVRHTAIYTKTDGVVDWRVCMTGDPSVDVEVSATHIGLVFSPLVYDLVAHRLAGQ